MLILWKDPKKEHDFFIADMHLVVWVESLIGLDTQLLGAFVPNMAFGFDCSALLAQRTGKG